MDPAEFCKFISKNSDYTWISEDFDILRISLIEGEGDLQICHGNVTIIVTCRNHENAIDKYMYFERGTIFKFTGEGCILVRGEKQHKTQLHPQQQPQRQQPQQQQPQQQQPQQQQPQQHQDCNLCKFQLFICSFLFIAVMMISIILTIFAAFEKYLGLFYTLVLTDIIVAVAFSFLCYLCYSKKVPCNLLL